MAVVSLFAVVGASLKQSIDDAVDKQFAGDLVIIGEGAGGLSTDLASAVAELPEVAAASPRGGGPVRIDGESTLVSTFDPATIESVENLDVRHGSLRGLRPDQVAVSADYAEQHGLAVGDPVTVDYPDGVTERPTVGAIYAEDNLSEGGGIKLPRDAYLPHTSRPADVNMLIALADGVTVAEGEAAVQRVADRFGAPDVQTNQEFTQSIAGEINLYLTVIYVLLILAIVIAVMGIANTLWRQAEALVAVRRSRCRRRPPRPGRPHGGAAARRAVAPGRDPAARPARTAGSRTAKPPNRPAFRACGAAGADAARGRGPGPGGPRLHQPPDRRHAGDQRQDRQRPRLAHPGEARRPEPGRSRRHRPPPGPGNTGRAERAAWLT